jgi:hypothetical protein
MKPSFSLYQKLSLFVMLSGLSTLSVAMEDNKNAEKNSHEDSKKTEFVNIDINKVWNSNIHQHTDPEYIYNRILDGANNSNFNQFGFFDKRSEYVHDDKSDDKSNKNVSHYATILAKKLSQEQLERIYNTSQIENKKLKSDKYRPQKEKAFYGLGLLSKAAKYAAIPAAAAAIIYYRVDSKNGLPLLWCAAIETLLCHLADNHFMDQANKRENSKRILDISQKAVELRTPIEQEVKQKKQQKEQLELREINAQLTLKEAKAKHINAQAELLQAKAIRLEFKQEKL